LRDGAFTIVDHWSADQDLGGPDAVCLQQLLANEYLEGIARFVAGNPKTSASASGTRFRALRKSFLPIGASRLAE
jgi:hypothetical protein